MPELAAKFISLRTGSAGSRALLRAQSLRGHNGTAGPPPNLRWTLSVASGMLGKRADFAKFIMPCGLSLAMATGRSLRQFILGSGFFLIAIAALLLLLEHDLLAFLIVPALVAALLLLEARQRLSTKS